MGCTKTKLPGRAKLFTTFTPPLDSSSATRPSEVAPPTDQTTPMDKMDLILQEIRESRAAMETQLGTLAADISIIRDEHHKLADRVHTTEKTLATLEPSMDEQVSITGQLRKQVELLKDRAEDTKGCACPNNVRIIGMPEGIEGAQATHFTKEWLQVVVSPTGLSAFFTMERAHRVPTKEPIPVAPPRLIVSKILNYRDREQFGRMAIIRWTEYWESYKRTTSLTYSY
ncbi:hypothetical protein NDU88_001320 [Pleurodeles waltl]|uniref:Uncharacterized protein n=1 Tax=Pleurodeles waltl TaxID=8319 RepID=A0AAV7WK55_PLEWA|nr:hypothetical protein NDU88_001320 [Pleurodeles waltl]